jgi:nucleoside-diphosphate-sugar epimerase
MRSLGAHPFSGDLANVTALTEAASGCDTTIHCAASVEIFGSLADARRVNVDGTNNVMEASRTAKVGRVVHVSSEAACVTRDAKPLVNLDESVPLPLDPYPGIYSTTKNEAERAAVAANGAGLEVVVVRPRFIWGKDDTVVLPALTEAANKGFLKWFDGGDYLTSTCHVDNVVEGIELAATLGRPGQAYFLTDGKPVSFKEFAGSMLKAVGATPPTSSMPLSVVWAAATICEWVCTVVRCKPVISRQELVLMGQQMTVSDELARKELGYKGHVKMADGLSDLRTRHAKTAQPKSEL